MYLYKIKEQNLFFIIFPHDRIFNVSLSNESNYQAQYFVLSF